MDIPFLSATLPELIRAVGYVGIFLIVFVESGVPIGLVLPLPGDTLLFSAGLLAATDAFDLFPLISTIVVAAVLGDSAGYWFGTRYGRKLFSKEDAIFLNPRHLTRTERFYEKYGTGALVIARFLPVLRTLVPIFAGIAHMPYRTFLLWNIFGALLWGISVTLLGYFLGNVIPNIDTYLLPVLGVVIVGSILYALWELQKAKRKAKNTAH